MINLDNVNLIMDIDNKRVFLAEVNKKLDIIKYTKKVLEER